MVANSTNMCSCPIVNITTAPKMLLWIFTLPMISETAHHRITLETLSQPSPPKQKQIRQIPLRGGDLEGRGMKHPQRSAVSSVSFFLCPFPASHQTLVSLDRQGRDKAFTLRTASAELLQQSQCRSSAALKWWSPSSSSPTQSQSSSSSSSSSLSFIFLFEEL